MDSLDSHGTQAGYPATNRLRRAIPKPALVTFTLGLVLLFAPAGQAQELFLDGDFSSWVEQFSFAGGSWARLTSGGNPDAHLELNVTDSLSSVIVRNGSVSYDPSTQGALASIRFEADVIGASDSSGSTQPAFGFWLGQGGEEYAAYLDFDLASWSSLATLELTPADFTNLAQGSQIPDFSGSGGAIQFGVIAGAGFSPGGIFLVDNYRVILAPATPVPASSGAGLAMLCVALVGLAFACGAGERAKSPSLDPSA